MSADLVARLREDAGNWCERTGVTVELEREAADEIERLRAAIEDGCKVFEHYDLPEHAFHYRRAALGMTPKEALKL
jgi:hypothetical protein